MYIIYTVKRSSWNQRYKRRCSSLIPADSDSLPHVHAHTTKTCYKHQDSRIKKAQVLKTKTFANSDIKDPSSETKLPGRLLKSFQDDANENDSGFLQNANASLTQELKECKSNLEETTRTIRESNSTRDSCVISLQNKEIELEKYKTYLNRTTKYDTLELILKDTQGLLAQKENEIKEGLKLKAYEISVANKKHDELVKHILLTKSSYESLIKEKNKVIKDLKLKEENDIDKLITMEKQLKFLNKIVYKQYQSIQTIHMLAPKCSTYNGRPTFSNPMYLKKAQSEKPCLYEIPYDTSDLANRFTPDREETLTLEQKSRSKLNKDLVKPYDHTKQNSLYEIFKPPSREYLDQLAHANKVRKKM
ncbi:hypothetical protein Tco_0553914 [Tanacetum coccineum]